MSTDDDQMVEDYLRELHIAAQGLPADRRDELIEEITVHIADCGPHTNDWCGERSCCNGNCASDRLLDLTPAAYSAIGNLSSGLIPMAVHS